MKKFFRLFLIATMCLSMVACGNDIKEQEATDEEKQAVIMAVNQCLDSNEYRLAVELFESASGENACEPQIINALTFAYVDYEGIAVDFILVNVKADTATYINDVFGFCEDIQFVIDRKTGIVYNSLTLQEKMVSMPIPIKTVEDAAVMIMCSSTLKENTGDWVYSEMEESTRFTKSDIQEMNMSLQ